MSHRKAFERDVAEYRKSKVVDEINNGLALFNERNRARALE